MAVQTVVPVAAVVVAAAAAAAAAVEAAARLPNLSLRGRVRGGAVAAVGVVVVAVGGWAGGQKGKEGHAPSTRTMRRPQMRTPRGPMYRGWW